jgi:hypothetical protein
MTVRAVVSQELALIGVVRLEVIRRRGEVLEVLMADGSWRQFAEGTAPPPNAGLPLPEDALAPIAEALAKYLGNALPSEAEVRILRSMLVKEQARVDQQLSRALVSPETRA